MIKAVKNWTDKKVYDAIVGALKFQAREFFNDLGKKPLTAERMRFLEKKWCD